MGRTKTQREYESGQLLRRLEDSQAVQKGDLAELHKEMRQMKALMVGLIEGMTQTYVTEMGKLREVIEGRDGGAQEFVNLEELHKMMGGSITKRTLANMCADGRLPAKKHGRLWLVPMNVIDKWKSEHNL